MASPTRLLLIDDDDRLIDLLTGYLAGHGFQVDVAKDGMLGLERFQRERPDLIVLDVMLPGLDGFECLRQFRRLGDVPVIMLTARGDDTDRIVGLELGADDYLSKPFNPRELVARIKSILRRAGSSPVPAEREGIHQFPTFTLDENRRTLEVRGMPVPLTSVEFELLRCLIQNAGRVMSRETLLDKVRGQDYAALDRTVDVHVSHLRQKLEDDPKDPRYLKTVWGIGYTFVREG